MLQQFWFTFFIKLNVTVFDKGFFVFSKSKVLSYKLSQYSIYSNIIAYFYYSGEVRGLVSFCYALVKLLFIM